MRTVLQVSDLNPNDVDLTPGSWWSLRCPECGRWRVIYRLRRVTSHRWSADDRWSAECPGSRRPVLVDLEPGEWAVRYQQAAAEAAALAGDVPFMPQTITPVQQALARC